MIFENDQLQTPKMKETVSLIMVESKELKATKKGTEENFFLLSPLMNEPAGITRTAAMRSRPRDPHDREYLLMKRS